MFTKLKIKSITHNVLIQVVPDKTAFGVLKIDT